MPYLPPDHALRPFGGNRPELGPRAFVDAAAVLIGAVRLGHEASVWPGAVLRGDLNQIEIGPRSNIQDGSVLHVASPSAEAPQYGRVVVGEEVTVGHKAILHACTVGACCLVGMGSIVLDGAVLEDEVMLGAGSLVSPGKRLTGGHLWLGSPARMVRPLKEAERVFLRESAAHYVALAARHAAELARSARFGP